MLFNSLVFLIFAAVFFAAWPVMRRGNNRRWAYITVASFFFYGWWDWRFLFLISGVGLVNFLAALPAEHHPRWRKAMLVVSVVASVGTLAVFKYLDFLVANCNGLAELLGARWRLPAAELILPVGISFYTFQAMSYAIDCYRGQLKPTHNVLHFFAYLSMFPQLVAGPIVRAAHLLPQLEKAHKPSPEERWEGTRLVVLGFFKKMVVADSLAPVVNAAFNAATPAESGAYWWTVMLLFAYQIYCDFSGYSDIARGLGRWMGYDFPLNFDHPYISSSFREFWTRWHISLSTWFRDYVYIPLGGSRHGKGRAFVYLWITMLVSGLWHGAAWAFLIWAALHALYMTLERLTKWSDRLCQLRAGRHVATLIVFLLTLLAWVFFRVGSLHDLSAGGQIRHAGQILATMFDFSKFHWAMMRHLIRSGPVNLTGLMILRQLWFYFRLDRRPGTLEIMESKAYRRCEVVAIALLIVGCVYFRGPGSAFIYFQF